MKYVGEIIKKRRLSKKFLLDEVSKELNISINVLEKIERDEFKVGVNDVFLIGHIKSYSKFLDLNSSEIVHMFKTQNSIGDKENIAEIPKPIFPSP